MNTNSLMVTAQVAGLVTTILFDPQAEPSESWRITVGENAQGLGPTPELALDGALRKVRAEDVHLKAVSVTVH